MCHHTCVCAIRTFFCPDTLQYKISHPPRRLCYCGSPSSLSPELRTSRISLSGQVEGQLFKERPRCSQPLSPTLPLGHRSQSPNCGATPNSICDLSACWRALLPGYVRCDRIHRASYSGAEPEARPRVPRPLRLLQGRHELGMRLKTEAPAPNAGKPRGRAPSQGPHPET